MAKILSGKILSKRLRDEMAQEVSKFNRKPGLGVLLVGEDPASQVYVRNKEKAAKKVGINSEVIRLPKDVDCQRVMQALTYLNCSPDIDAFIVQLPLPKHLDEKEILNNILPERDADGLHPANLGKLMSCIPAPRSCTPSGIMYMLEETGIDLSGKKAVVVGRSTIVGKPVAHMLLERNATVTMCHSRTKYLSEEVRSADVVVAAVGVPNLIQGDWISDGAIVIDVGINRVDGQLVGDVDFDLAEKRASYITPVPGGVGPMTIAFLLKNTIEIFRRNDMNKT